MECVSINDDFKSPTGREHCFRSLDHPIGFFDLSKKEQAILKAWCNKIEKSKIMNNSHTSYGLKHIFEDSKDGFYVTNGQFKGAMLECGFCINDKTKTNWSFNIKKKSIRELRNDNRMERI